MSEKNVWNVPNKFELKNSKVKLRNNENKVNCNYIAVIKKEKRKLKQRLKT